MLFEIDHRSGVPIYRQIMDQVTEQILTGLLKEGEQVMTVRELAAILNINPMTVSKAYSLMEAEGLLERRRGVGLFVAKSLSGTRDRARETALDTILKKVVTTATQYGMSKQAVQKRLDEMFCRYQTDKRGDSK